MTPQIRSQLGARWEEVVSGSPRGRTGASWEGHPGVGHELSCCLEPPPQRDLFSGSQASLPRFQGTRAHQNSSNSMHGPSESRTQPCRLPGPLACPPSPGSVVEAAQEEGRRRPCAPLLFLPLQNPVPSAWITFQPLTSDSWPPKQQLDICTHYKSITSWSS